MKDTFGKKENRKAYQILDEEVCSLCGKKGYCRGFLAQNPFCGDPCYKLVSYWLLKFDGDYESAIIEANQDYQDGVNRSSCKKFVKSETKLKEEKNAQQKKP